MNEFEIDPEAKAASAWIIRMIGICTLVGVLILLAGCSYNGSIEISPFVSDKSGFQGMSVGTTAGSNYLAHISVRESNNLGGLSVGIGKNVGSIRVIVGVTEANSLEPESGFVDVGGVPVFDNYAKVKADNVVFIDAEYNGWFAQYTEYEASYRLKGFRSTSGLFPRTISADKTISFDDSVFYIGYRFRLP